jgi:uncharacterized membrane protein
MLRTLAKKHYLGMASTFRYRGEEPSRIEALSDSCFALAIGLLLISTKSPDTFEELFDFTKDLIPFALCLTMIMLVWHQHFVFFIRYGFRNAVIVVLNSILLLILLFYVYPLKFLARFLTNIYGSLLGNLFGMDIQVNNIQLTDGGDLPALMITYSWGVAGIFLVLMFMYRYALKNKEELELNEIEIFETKTSIISNMLMAGIALLSILLAMVIPHPIIGAFLAGCSYLLCWPVMVVFAKKRNTLRKAILEKPNSAEIRLTGSE